MLRMSTYIVNVYIRTCVYKMSILVFNFVFCLHYTYVLTHAYSVVLIYRLYVGNAKESN